LRSEKEKIIPGKDFSSLKEVMGGLIKRLGLDEELRAWQAVLKWKEIVGEKVVKYAKAVEVKDGVLYISCPNPTWRTQLTLMREEIISKANELLGKRLIREIKFFKGKY